MSKYLKSAASYYLTEGRRDGLPMPEYLKRFAKRKKQQPKWLQSWWTLKASVIIERGSRCERCKAYGEVELHRKPGVLCGKERREDVELLCPACCP